MSPSPILRFAPSPNGYLHIGHAYSALFTAQWATRLDAKFVLRMEDIDITRCKPEFEQAIFEDLHWLGLEWPEPVMRQSHRFDIYNQAANQLKDMGLLYPCFCSRSDIAAQSKSTDPDGAPVYPGTCRHLSDAEVSDKLAANTPAQWRLDILAATAKTGMLTFTSAQPTPTDRPQIHYAKPQSWGDVIIQRKDMPTSYHLSVVIDDATQNITHVTRGRDMEAATHIHILLQFLLGLPSPIYTFHRLIMDETDQKLSKSKQALSIRALRQAGETADQLCTRLGFC